MGGRVSRGAPEHPPKRQDCRCAFGRRTAKNEHSLRNQHCLGQKARLFRCDLPELEATGSYRAEAVLGIEQAIVNWHMEHEENPPKAPPKTAHELDARFDDGEGTTLLGFGK